MNILASCRVGEWGIYLDCIVKEGTFKEVTFLQRPEGSEELVAEEEKVLNSWVKI